MEPSTSSTNQSGGSSASLVSLPTSRRIVRTFPAFSLDEPVDDYYERLVSLQGAFPQEVAAEAISSCDDLPLDVPVHWLLYHGTFHVSKTSPLDKPDVASNPSVVCFTLRQQFADSYGALANGVYAPKTQWRTFAACPRQRLVFRLIDHGPDNIEGSTDLIIAVPPREHRARTSPIAYQDQVLPKLAAIEGFDGLVTWDTSSTNVGQHLTIHVFRNSAEAKIELLGAIDHHLTVTNCEIHPSPSILDRLLGRLPPTVQYQEMVDEQVIHTGVPTLALLIPS